MMVMVRIIMMVMVIMMVMFNVAVCVFEMMSLCLCAHLIYHNIMKRGQIMMKIMMLMIRVMMMTLVLRARLIRSFSLRTVANRGRLWYNINVYHLVYKE